MYKDLLTMDEFDNGKGSLDNGYFDNLNNKFLNKYKNI
jgi:hypothetical protein